MSRAKNLNAPEHWKAWIIACKKDEWAAKLLNVPGPLAMLTRGDVRVLGAIAHCWHVYAGGDLAMQAGALAAIRALLPGMQAKCHGFARELIAQQMEWHTRERLWPLVALEPDEPGVMTLEIRAASSAEMVRALESAMGDARSRLAFDTMISAKGEPAARTWSPGDIPETADSPDAPVTVEIHGSGGAVSRRVYRRDELPPVLLAGNLRLNVQRDAKPEDEESELEP